MKVGNHSNLDSKNISLCNMLIPYSYAGMKISYISVDISSIYPISVMFDTISMMTDISILDRYIVEMSGLWHKRVSLIFR